MALSYLGCNWDDMQALIKAMQPDICPSGNTIAKHLQTWAFQLSRFHDAATIGAKFTVDSFGLDQQHYLIWTKTQEEAILNVQGIIAEAYIPPITNTNMKSLSKAYQSIKIISSEDDTQFTNALHAIDRLENFMSCHYSPMKKKASPDMVGTIPAIRAENWLLVSSHVEFQADQKNNLDNPPCQHGLVILYTSFQWEKSLPDPIRSDLSIGPQRKRCALKGAIKSRAKDAARDGCTPKKCWLSIGNVDAEL
ncbi:hypothetical protein EDD85DRAFT_785530 [Armillaria nabsnona]|nr:hypothetical protein EDD85DRAFT_785530 [Armillaria nabsnona]